MKQLASIILFIVLQDISHAQTPAVNSQSQQQQLFAGYLIRLIPLNGNGYGYDIFYKNKLAVHQSVNPFTLTPDGIRQSGDAFKVAKWQILQLRSFNSGMRIKNQPISKEVAQKLSINLNPANKQ